MNRQKVFDKVVRHLLKQGRKSHNTSGCKYRMTSCNTTLKCAIGCLITKRNYKKELEGYPVCNSAVNMAIQHSLGLKKLLSENDAHFLQGLQCIHDLKYPITWSECLKQFAEKNKLKFNPSKGYEPKSGK